MAKRKIIRKSNKPLTFNTPNYYSWGGDFKAALGDVEPLDFKSTFSGGNVAGMLKGGLASGIGSTMGNIAGGAISGGLESGAGSAISNIGGTIGGAVSAVNPVLGGIISAGSGILGGAANALFGSKLNQEKINEIEGSNKGMNTLMVDSSSADNIEDQWLNQDFGSDFSKSDIGKDGLFSNKAKNKYKVLKKQQDIARGRALTAFENAADAADMVTDLNAAANFAAYGGPLGIWGGYGSGAIGYELAKENLGIKALNAANKGRLTSLPNSFESSELNTFAKGGKIHIKPENRGKFTKYCGGKVTSECIQRGLHSSNPTTRQRANFARNARKFKHADGGPLNPYSAGALVNSIYSSSRGWNNTHGGDFSNGVIQINSGGLHSTNPFGGVPMGVDNQGTPNLVEQGEVIFNDYVFSNRLFADGGLLESFNLPKSYDGYSFAAIAEKLGDESKERPNDPISKRGLLSSMSRLQQAQETVRQQAQEGQEGVQYAHGGKMGTLFDELGDESNFLDGVDYGDNSSKLTWLRYAPVVGSAIGLAQNLFSKPDYSSADAILEVANSAGNYTPIGYTPIGNYLQYRPLDRNYYINRLDAQAGATRRAIMNTTSPSRNAALLAADYNAQGRLGDLARQAEEYNLAQRQAVETFNKGTNMANAEMGLKAAMANQEAALKARSSRLSGVSQAMAVRDAVDARKGASMSANLTNLFDSLGNIGIDTYNREDRDKLIRAGVFGTLSEKPQEWSNKRWEDYKKAVSGTGYRNGGKLKKKRGGFTY